MFFMFFFSDFQILMNQEAHIRHIRTKFYIENEIWLNLRRILSRFFFIDAHFLLEKFSAFNQEINLKKINSDFPNRFQNKQHNGQSYVYKNKCFKFQKSGNTGHKRIAPHQNALDNVF